MDKLQAGWIISHFPAGILSSLSESAQFGFLMAMKSPSLSNLVITS